MRPSRMLFESSMEMRDGSGEGARIAPLKVTGTFSEASWPGFARYELIMVVWCLWRWRQAHDVSLTGDIEGSQADEEQWTSWERER